LAAAVAVTVAVSQSVSELVEPAPFVSGELAGPGLLGPVDEEPTGCQRRSKTGSGRLSGVTVPLGDKSRFAVEIGNWHGGLRRVDLWAAGQWLTCDDNWAYVKQLRHSVQADCAWLTSGGGSPTPFPRLSSAATHRRLLADDEGLREQWWFLHWGPTTDNVSAHLFRDGDHLTITLQFWREEHLHLHPEHVGAVFVVEIETEEFVEILRDTITILEQEPTPPSP
jgi:hypothetical protein